MREGDRVKAGDIIAVLDDQQIRDREEQAQAVLAGEEAKAVAARDQIAFLDEQLRQNQMQTEQSSVDAEGRVRQAEADMAAAEADEAQQEAAYDLAAVRPGRLHGARENGSCLRAPGEAIHIHRPAAGRRGGRSQTPRRSVKGSH